MNKLINLIRKVLKEETPTLNEQSGSWNNWLTADAATQCKLCNMQYWTTAQRNKYCRCSTCTCSTGQVDNRLLCAVCNAMHWTTAQRNKYCRCSTCVCSQRPGVTTTTKFDGDKDFRGPSEFDAGGAQSNKKAVAIHTGNLNESILLNERDSCRCFWRGGFGPDGFHREWVKEGCSGTDRCSCTYKICIPNPIPGNEMVGTPGTNDDDSDLELSADIKRRLDEVAVSKSQKRFWQFVKSCKTSKYKDCGTGTDIKNAAKTTSMKEINKYVKTPDKGLPEKTTNTEQELEEKYWWLNRWRLPMKKYRGYY